MLNIAVIGMGKIGNNHATCYSKNPHCKLVAVVDMLREKADEAARKFDCRAFESIEEMRTAGVKPDAASVCTSGKENGSDHYAPTMELLRAEIPVLGEKPISNNLSHAREMVATAREKKVPYAINLNHRFTPAAKLARKWLDAGRLGEVNLINMSLLLNNPNDSSPHFHIQALHPHSIDVMRYFGGDVKKVQAFFKKGPGRSSWSNVQVNLLFENGALGHLTGSYEGGPGYGLETCDIIGSAGRAVIREVCQQVAFYPRMSKEPDLHDNPGGMMSFAETFQSRIDAWVDDLVKKTPPEKIDGKAEDALKAQEIIDAAIRSWETDSIIEL